jgi:hypothetical protein
MRSNCPSEVEASVEESARHALVTGPKRRSGFQRSWRLTASVRLLKDHDRAICSRDVAEVGRVVAEYVLDLRDPASAAALFRTQGVAA